MINYMRPKIKGGVVFTHLLAACWPQDGKTIFACVRVLWLSSTCRDPSTGGDVSSGTFSTREAR